MNITIEKSQNLSQEKLQEINRVVARGFGVNQDTMQEDTISHLKDADHIQIATNTSREIVAVAMYKQCLWRTCY